MRSSEDIETFQISIFKYLPGMTFVHTRLPIRENSVNVSTVQKFGVISKWCLGILGSASMTPVCNIL